MEKNREYYIGLDIGTDSVGYAVTDERYKLLKFKGEPMWGSHLFDPGKQCAERRAFRTARRRLDRRQQRVRLVDEIFAPEVIKVDPNFYIRKKESALWAEDKSVQNEPYLFFNGLKYSERDYYKQYPTIHHLICDLMKESDKKHDIRLINIAVDWLVAHRGHFLMDIGISNVDKVLDFSSIYEEFISWFDEHDMERPWDKTDIEELGNILKTKGTNRKKTELGRLLYGGKIPSGDDYFLNRKELVNFISGGKVACNKLFANSEYEDDLKITISDDMEAVLPQLGDDAELISRIAAMYDWSVLSDIMKGNTYISESKVKVYNQHKEDLKLFKKFVKKYAPEKYYEMFRKSGKELCNYTAYSYNVKSMKGKELPKEKATQEDFCAFLKKSLKLDKMEVDSEDQEFFEKMKKEVEENTFLPKQINIDNRVIPHQLYLVELIKILENAGKHYPSLLEEDEDGYRNIDKLISIFKFRIPYYVGPLRTDNSEFAWMVRKADISEPIYPWNFDKVVDLDESENAFINRMTNVCTYLPGEDVLPKWSITYSKYMVLNEINNIKVNDSPIPPEVKQEIYRELFVENKKVTVKKITVEKIKEYLISNGYMKEQDRLGGLDETIQSSLKPLYDFRRLTENGLLSLDDVDHIVKHCTYTEDKNRYRRWINETYPQLSEEDREYIGRQKYKDFGRLSYSFLNELEGINRETGEVGTIMHFLWETNDNLMKLLSDRYSFMEEIREKRTAYYQEHPSTIMEQMEEMGLSNAVKRPVTRTLAVVKDVTSTLGYTPKKIFVEMARGADEKKERKVTRKEQIMTLYRSCEEDTSELEHQLELMGETANNQLQSEALFLYYIQLGRCMYSGDPIDIQLLKSSMYNIDHIYPQSMVKDDSVLNNKVLVLSEINGDKQDIYPIKSEIRNKMFAFWTKLERNGLITKEKYARLIRQTKFSPEEKMGFINRQLVETRQSMKAVTNLLQILYPETEIIYVKARLSADFKQTFKFPPKSRIINDLHHAKDAYLNIVVGNVYHERFTRRFFSVEEKYTLNTKVLFTSDLKRENQVIWKADIDLPTVKDTYNKNHIHLTRYAFCQQGGLFDQKPVKKGQGQVSIKKGMSIDKYGGYNKATASFFVLAKYLKGGKIEVAFVPVELMYSSKFLKDELFAKQYIQRFLEGINTKKIENVSFPIGIRKIKFKSVISLDGFRVWINGKANKGAIVLLTSAESAIYSVENVKYIKKIENYSEKKKINKKLVHDSENDKLSVDSNIKLYDELMQKLGNSHFSKMPGNQYEVVMNGREQFTLLEFDLQIKVLQSIVDLLKSGRTGGCDLSCIGGKAQSGVVNIGANISSMIKHYSDIRLIDVSPAGLHEKTSVNLRELL